MPATGYVFSTLDDDSIVPSPTSKTQAHSTSVMDHQNTTTTLRSTKKPLADDEKEELELESFMDKKDILLDQEQQQEVLAKKDYGNFTLLVILCKLHCFQKIHGLLMKMKKICYKVFLLDFVLDQFHSY